MLKVDENLIEIRGTKLSLMAELSSLINALYTKEAITKEDIELCVKTALLSKEELNEALQANIEELIGWITGEGDNNDTK